MHRCVIGTRALEREQRARDAAGIHVVHCTASAGKGSKDDRQWHAEQHSCLRLRSYSSRKWQVREQLDARQIDTAIGGAGLQHHNRESKTPGGGGGAGGCTGGGGGGGGGATGTTGSEARGSIAVGSSHVNVMFNSLSSGSENARRMASVNCA